MIGCIQNINENHQRKIRQALKKRHIQRQTGKFFEERVMITQIQLLVVL